MKTSILKLNHEEITQIVGAFDFNIVAAIFGTTSIITRFTFATVGLAAIYILGVFIPKVINRK